jgi:hypothetical protein
MRPVVHHCSDHTDPIHRSTTFASFLILGFLEIGQEMYVITTAPLRDSSSPHYTAVKTPSVTMRTTSVSWPPCCTAKRLFTFCFVRYRRILPRYSTRFARNHNSEHPPTPTGPVAGAVLIVFLSSMLCLTRLTLCSQTTNLSLPPIAGVRQNSSPARVSNTPNPVLTVLIACVARSSRTGRRSTRSRARRAGSTATKRDAIPRSATNMSYI